MDNLQGPDHPERREIKQGELNQSLQVILESWDRRGETIVRACLQLHQSPCFLTLCPSPAMSSSSTGLATSTSTDELSFSFHPSASLPPHHVLMVRVESFQIRDHGRICPCDVNKKSSVRQQFFVGMVHTYVGQKVTALTTDGRPFCTIFLHTTSLKRCDKSQNTTTTGTNTATMVVEPPSSLATWS